MPSAWAMKGFQNILIRGLSGSSTYLPALVLLAYALGFFLLAVWRFRRMGRSKIIFHINQEAVWIFLPDSLFKCFVPSPGPSPLTLLRSATGCYTISIGRGEKRRFAGERGADM